jgi:Fe-S oxidoreductase
LRLREALATGAEIIATACPICLRMLKTAASELGVLDRIAVRDLAELLLESVRGGDDTETQKSAISGVDQEVCHV